MSLIGTVTFTKAVFPAPATHAKYAFVDKLASGVEKDVSVIPADLLIKTIQ